jgi:hypothetical protein
VHLPSGTRIYDQQLVAATRAIRGLLLDDTIVTDDLPSALFTKIRDQCEEEVDTFCKQRKYSLTKSMHRQLRLTFPSLPSLEDVQAGGSFSNPVTLIWQVCQDHQNRGSSPMKNIAKRESRL